jgi:REP element-mobilizing transposase RayT
MKNIHTKLPHIDLQGYYQFVTFRTQDSICKYIQDIQDNQGLNTAIKQQNIDDYLDTSLDGAYIVGENIDILRDIILYRNNTMYEIIIFCIMPNHVHMLFKQISSLKDSMRYIKSKSAIQLNKNINRTGKFWLSGYFDKVIRDEKHLAVVYKYIANNALKANLKDHKQRVYSSYH